MKLNKYSESKDGLTVVGSFADRKNSSGASSPATQPSSPRVDRELWGQQDNGDDIDGDMAINGNVFIGEADYGEEEDDEQAPDAGNGHEFPSEKGNLFAENSVESPEVYGNTVYIDYKRPYEEGDPRKTDVSKLFTENSAQIENLVLNLNTVERRLTENEAQVRKIWETIEDLEGGGDGGGCDCEPPEVPTKTSDLENDSGFITKDDLPEIYERNPAILFSGILESDNSNSSSGNYKTFFFNRECEALHYGVQGIDLRYQTGRPTLQLTVLARSGWTVKATSVTAMVMQTNDYDAKTALNGVLRGAGYWMTGGTDGDNVVYLNAWRTDDGNNDGTTCDQIAWNVKKISVTIFGLCFKTPAS